VLSGLEAHLLTGIEIALHAPGFGGLPPAPTARVG
jgi:hypothetical protein